MKPTETIDFTIRSTWHKIARVYNVQAAEHGVSMAVGMILLNIDSTEGTPSTKLGPKMGMESRSLSRSLKQLEEAGIIYRKADSNDKRLSMVFLTDLGKKKRALAKDSVVTFNNFIKERLTTEEFASFFSVMKSVNSIIDSYGNSHLK